MASSKNLIPWFCYTFLPLILLAQTCHGFYFLGPDMHTHTFSDDDVMFVEVNSLTSTRTELPFSYYSLPYCKPQEGVQKSEVNIGQLLLGDQILNSPYRFQMNVNETVFLCAKGPLTADEVRLLKQRIHNRYQVNMILDNLPVIRYVWSRRGLAFQGIGFPVGYKPHYSTGDYIFNHLKFRVLFHENKVRGLKIISSGEEGLGIITLADKEESSEYEIVGFEVVPCSVKHNPSDMSKPIKCPLDLGKSQIIQENETIAFTYEVEFVKSEIKWRSRWDAYLEVGHSEIRRSSILSSVITIFILAGIVLVIYSRSLRKEPQALPGWKLVVGDVFREPRCAKLLCVMVGGGVQIIGMAFATIVFNALGFIALFAQGTLLTSLITLYLLFSIAAGFTAVRLLRTIKGSSEKWKSVSSSVACFFPGIVFVAMTFSNLLLSDTKTTRVIPFSLFFILISLWFSISVPLALIGGFLGTKGELIQYPVQTNQVPREIQARKYSPWLLVVGSGILPFGTIFIELFLILYSIVNGRFYCEFGFLLVALLSLVIVCALVSVILTYRRLSVGDWCWWWKAFFGSGSAGVYVILYSIFFLVAKLNGLSEPVSAVVFMGYSLIMAIAVMLASGAIGFLVSFYSLHCLYSSAKIDC